MKTVIKNANIVLEYGILSDGILLIEDGRIAAFGPEKEMKIPENSHIIDAEGAYVGPGFVDIHVHGGGGYSTCTDPEKAALHFLRHGETSLLCTTDYCQDLPCMLKAISTIRTAMEHTPSIKGIYMEGPYINHKYGASADENPWKSRVIESEYKALVDACGDAVKIWTIAPELDNLLPFLAYAKQVNPSVVFAAGHSHATPMEIRALGEYRPTLMTHVFNATGRLPVHGGTRGIGPDEYCLKEPDMYAEVISDSQGLHVHPELQQLLLHCKGTEKVILITDSTLSEHPSPEEYAHITDLNFDHNGGLDGSKMTMDMACRNFMASTGCSVAEIFRMASLNPAKVIGMDDTIGSVAVGKTADLVFVDDRFCVKNVMLAGEICRFEEE